MSCTQTDVPEACDAWTGSSSLTLPPPLPPPCVQETNAGEVPTERGGFFIPSGGISAPCQNFPGCDGNTTWVEVRG